MADLSFTKRQNHTQSKKLSTMFSSLCSHIEETLFPLWVELYGSNIIEERCDTVKGALTQLVEEMIREEEENKSEYQMKYDALLVEANTLETELSIVVPRTEVGNEPLCVKIRSLERDLEDHRRARSERLRRLNELQAKEKELCAQLEQDTQYSLVNTVPSESTLTQIQSHNKCLESELKSRHARYSLLRGQIIELWRSLELKPEGTFELSVQQNGLEKKLGNTNLNHLASVAQRLESARNEMEKEMDALRYKLSTLWNRLDTDVNERESFLTSHNRLCVSSLAAWRREIDACTALKLKRIHQIVDAIREELLDWWNRARVGQTQRDMFTDFNLEEDITEEILENHEKEVERVKQYYEENRDILDLLDKRFELWKEMIELEDKANDKDRLFKNRGGQLLLEEKQRKFIQKELPKLEKRLDKLFDRFEAATGHPFLYDGHDARATIVNQWAERSSAKENVKNARKNVVSSSQASKSKLLGPPQNVTARNTPLRNATLKRKGENTPALAAKRGRLLESAAKTPATPSYIVGSATKKPQAGGSSPASSVLSYSLFQNQLDVDTALNSTYNTKPKSAQSGGLNKAADNTKSTPLPATKPKPPARSKLLSPKIRAKAAGNAPIRRLPPTPLSGVSNLTRSRSQTCLTPRGNGTLTRSRTQTQLTPHTPRHKLPFIF